MTHRGASFTTAQISEFLQAIGLSHHVEAFSEGCGVDGAHLKMIMDQDDWRSVLADYGISSAKEQIQLRAHWERIGSSEGAAAGRGGRGRGRGGRGGGRGQLSAAAPGSSTAPSTAPSTAASTAAARSETTTPSASASALPPGWHEAASSDGVPYYYDDRGRTQWEHPATPAAPAAPPPPSEASAPYPPSEAAAARATTRAEEGERERAELRSQMRRLAEERRIKTEAAEAETAAAAEAEARRARVQAQVQAAAEREDKERRQRISQLQAEEERRREQQRRKEEEEEEERRHGKATQRGELARLLPSPTAGADGASQRNVVLDVANLGHYTASNAAPRFGRDCRWHDSSWSQIQLAAEYYQERGVAVHALLNPHTRARIEREFPMPARLAKLVQVVPRTRGAKDPDDRFILHAACLLGCQFVSNDNYSEWHERFLNEG